MIKPNMTDEEIARIKLAREKGYVPFELDDARRLRMRYNISDSIDSSKIRQELLDIFPRFENLSVAQKRAFSSGIANYNKQRKIARIPEGEIKRKRKPLEIVIIKRSRVIRPPSSTKNIVMVTDRKGRYFSRGDRIEDTWIAKGIDGKNYVMATAKLTSGKIKRGVLGVIK